MTEAEQLELEREVIHLRKLAKLRLTRIGQLRAEIKKLQEDNEFLRAIPKDKEWMEEYQDRFLNPT